MHWSDAHSHLCTLESLESAAAHIEEARTAGCALILDVATDLPSLERGRTLQALWSGYRLAAAITPHDAANPPEGLWEAVEEGLLQGSLVAVGETGLDAGFDQTHMEAQSGWCIRQMALARTHRRPLIIHCRDAFDPLFSLCDEHYQEGGRWLPGMLHCFTGGLKEAERLVEQGWILSLSGIVTYPRAEALRAVVEAMPLGSLVIESDAPWLAPVPYRGKPNRPAWCLETIKVIAQVKGVTVEEVAAASLQTLDRYFHLGVEVGSERERVFGVPASSLGDSE